MTERMVKLAGVPVTVDGARDYQDFWDRVDRGEWEQATIHALVELTDGAVYVDVGAWIGPTVMAAAARATRVVAFEPDPVAAKVLRRNVELNGWDHVEVREVALLDRNGEFLLSPGRPGEFGQSESSLVYGTGSLRVRGADAQAEAQRPPFTECSVLKIDVEGAEYRLIRALAPYIRSHRPALLLSLHGIHWRKRRFEPLPRFLASSYRRIRSAAERVPLMWRLRHYRYAYLDVEGNWRPMSAVRRWALVFGVSEQGLLLRERPFQ